MAHWLLQKVGLGYFTFESRLRLTKVERASLEHFLKLYKGKLWDNGSGYIGPLADPDDKNERLITTNLRRMFGEGYRNPSKDCVDRAVDGVLSKSPDWRVTDQQVTLARSEQVAQAKAKLQERMTAANTSVQAIMTTGAVPQPGQQPPAPQPQPQPVPLQPPQPGQPPQPQLDQEPTNDVLAERILNELWTQSSLAQLIKEVLTKAMLVTKGHVRIFIPRRFRKPDGSLNAPKDWMDACKYVRAEFVPHDRAQVLDDYGDRLGIAKVEHERLDVVSQSVQRQVEISFVDDDGLSYIATIDYGQKMAVTSISKQESKQVPADTANPDEKNPPTTEQLIEQLKTIADVSDPIFLDGEIVIGEMQQELLLTQQFEQSMKGLNLSMTMGTTVLGQEGFPELAGTNIELDEEEVRDDSVPGGVKTVAKGIKRGGGRFNNFVGLSTIDKDGLEHYADPRLYWKEPSPIQSFVDGKTLYYQACLEEVAQLFVITTGDGNLAAESRIQARQDFLKRAERFKPGTDKFGSWLLRTMLHMVAFAMGKDAFFKGYKVDFDSQLFAGELSADEKNVVVSQYEAGLLSRETAIMLLGSEDPLIEIDKIRAEEAEGLVNSVTKMAATAKFSQQNKEGGNNPPPA
jgi:hypothetical protein